MEARGIEIVADMPTENAQADFAADVVKVKNSDAEAIFVYLTEEESARFLREAKKQGVGKPLVGETTLIGQKVIDLAGDAANGAMGHVGLTPDAPNPQVQEMAAKFEEKFGYRPDHNAIKGYIGAYAIKYATEQVGEFDSEKIAEHLHGLKLIAAEHPGHPDRRQLGRHRRGLARELPRRGRGRQAGRQGDAAGQLTHRRPRPAAAAGRHPSAPTAARASAPAGPFASGEA